MKDGSTSSSDDQSKSSTSSDRSNPFVAFRRFADDQMASFFEPLFEGIDAVFDAAFDSIGPRRFKRDLQAQSERLSNSQLKSGDESRMRHEGLKNDQQDTGEMASDEEKVKAYGDSLSKQYDEDRLARVRKHFASLSPQDKTSADEEMGRVYSDHMSEDYDEDRLQRARGHWASSERPRPSSSLQGSQPSGQPVSVSEDISQGSSLPESFSKASSDDEKSACSLLQTKSDDSEGVRKIYLVGGGSLSSPDDGAHDTTEGFRWNTCPFDQFEGTSDIHAGRKSKYTVFPLVYVLMSSYSPIKLQGDRESGEPDWTDAFEDLLFAADGMEMPTQKALEGAGTLEDWMQDVTYRLRLRQEQDKIAKERSQGTRVMSMLAPFQGLMGHNGVTGEDGDAETELDLYTHIFGQTETDSQTRTMANTAPTDHDSRKPPSILSTMTTTMRTTGPDGAVHTKVVLKKRFADGTEESSESVHTTPLENFGSDVLRQQSARGSSVIGEEVKRREGGKGWFWKS
ncbi:MAG: hypothetical protein M1816_000589 [Peltula sp. TS41687]|nr:MAG: hypothetical protein M1816_000589 [Peltula sp. TS41687]